MYVKIFILSFRNEGENAKQSEENMMSNCEWIQKISTLWLDTVKVKLANVEQIIVI